MGNAAPARRAELAYLLIDSKASANAFIQGITGFGGFPFTLAADVGTVPLIYARMWNDIRRLYGQPELDTTALLGVVKPMLPELLADLVLDKFLGNVPIVGIYFNAICAKALTWRLGTLFTFLSSRGAEIPSDAVRKAAVLVREMFPQRDLFAFASPARARFLDLVESVEGVEKDDFTERVGRALEAFDIPSDAGRARAAPPEPSPWPKDIPPPVLDEPPDPQLTKWFGYAQDNWERWAADHVSPYCPEIVFFALDERRLRAFRESARLASHWRMRREYDPDRPGRGHLAEPDGPGERPYLSILPITETTGRYYTTGHFDLDLHGFTKATAETRCGRRGWCFRRGEGPCRWEGCGTRSSGAADG